MNLTSSTRKLPTQVGGNRASGGGAQGAGPHLLLYALRRWWKIALPAGVLLAVAAMGVVYCQFEPLYEASTLLEMSESNPYLAFKPDDGGVSKAYFHTQIDLIRSRWIIGRTVASTNVKDLPEIRKQAEPIDWLRRKINVVLSGDSNAFEIRYISPDPESAALVVNEVARQYLTAMAEEESSRFRNILDALTEQLRARDENVRTLRKQVEALAEKVPVEEPEIGEREVRPAVKNSLAELQSQLVSVQVRREILSAQIRAREEEIRKADEVAARASAATAKSTAASPEKKVHRALSREELELRDELVEQGLYGALEVRQASSQLFSDQVLLDQLEKIYKQGKNDPAYIRKKGEIAEREKSIEKLKEKLRPRVEKEVEFTIRAKQVAGAGGGVDGVIAETARRRDELDKMRLDLRSYEIAEENLRSAYAKELTKVLAEREQLSGETLNLKFKKDELAEAQAVLARINDRQIQLLTEQSAPSRVIWHDPAKPQQSPLEASPYRNMSLAGLVAFCLPFALAVAWEIRVRRIGSPEDLEQQLHMTVLGEIARLPTRNRSAAKRLSEGHIGAELRIFEESVDSLRTALTLSDDLRDMRILAITSAANSEGKTSVASQLALSLARATGKMTLLIDGDMRSPDVHQVFGVARGPGLAEVLSNECSLTDAIIPTHNPNVQLLPAGRLKVSPHRLLGNGAWKSLLAQIPSNYGYVIVDTPPVLAASEALVLSKYADAILICVMRDVSRTDQVRKASNLLTAAGGCPVGTVLNGVPTRSYRFYYGSYPSPPAHSHA